LTIGVFLLSLALMAVLWWFTPQGFGLVDGLTVIAVGGGAMLAVAAAVTLFSVEKEEGTAELLGRLPRNVVAMTVGKLGAAAISVPFCTAALLLMAWWIAGVTPDAQQVNTVVLPQASLFLLEAFVWSLVASLACPNPLVAAVLGIALSSVSVQIGIYLENPASRGVSSEALSAAAPERLVMAAIGMLMAGWLVSKWPTPLRVHRAAEITTLKEPTRKNPLATWLGAFVRLFWQTVRQSWVTGVVATLLGLFLTFMGVLILNGILSLNFGWNYASGYGALFAPAMLGAVVFRADQRRGAYRFLAEHAGRPRLLWLARNTAGLALLTLFSLLLVALLLGVWWFLVPDSMNFDWRYQTSPGVESLQAIQGVGAVWRAALIAGAAVLTAYAWGQFFSLALRSDVIAAMLALITSIALLSWAWVVWSWRLPPLTFLLPLAIGAMLASLLRVCDWMFDRRRLWRWAAPLVAIAAPIAWLAWATPVMRLAQVDMPLQPVWTGDDSYSRFEVLATEAHDERRLGAEVAEAYERLEAQVVDFKPSDRRINGIQQKVATPKNGGLKEEALKEFLQLSRIKCRPPVPSGAQTQGGILQAIARQAAPGFEEAINLDLQLERLLACRGMAIQQMNGQPLHVRANLGYSVPEFVDWATAEGQTVERIKKAIQGLGDREELVLTPVERLMNDHQEARAIIKGESPPPFMTGQNAKPRADQWQAYLVNETLDFERKRALKALDLYVAYHAAYLGEGMRSLDSGTPANTWLEPSALGDVRLVTALPYNVQRRSGSYLDDLDTLANVRTSGLVVMAFSRRIDPADALRDWLTGVAWRRAERVRLALIAYRLEYDEYPDRLQVLSPRYLQSKDLLDPFTGSPFNWAAEGITYTADISRNLGGFVSPPLRTPLLWSEGTKIDAFAEAAASMRASEALADRLEREKLKMLRKYPGFELMRAVSPGESQPDRNGSFWMSLPK
jgi:hypothetical protein